MRRVEVAIATAVLSVLCLATALAALSGSVEDQIAQLPPALRQHLRTREAAVQAMTPAQQQALHQRIADWDALPLAERRRRRERWQAWQGLAPGERWQVRTVAQRFVALPAAEQQALQAQFESLDGSERRGWLLGPGLGAVYLGLRPLLMQVPEADREPLLAVLRAMTVAERLDLVTLAQRTPPQEREALRRELLSTSGANRAAWLRSRLER